MKRRVALVGLVLLASLTAVYFGWQGYSWNTVCIAHSPDGFRRAVVRRHWLPAGMDGRYHYYLSFDPPVAFRPVAGETTLKLGASAVKADCVVYDWGTTHYMGYLQGFDNLATRAPLTIEWVGELVVVHAQEGVAGQYEFRR